jgi:hypothetical protein
VSPQIVTTTGPKGETGVGAATQDSIDAAVKNKQPLPGATTGQPAGSVGGMEYNVAAYNRDLASASTFKNNINPIEQSIGLLEKLGSKSTGPGKDEWNTIKQAMSNLPGIGDTFDNIFPADQTTNYQELRKYLQGIVNTSPLASESDKRYAGAVNGLPNTGISTEADTALLKSAYRLMKADAAFPLYTVNKGGDQQKYLENKAKMQQNIDVDPFEYGRTPQQQAAIFQQKQADLKSSDPVKKQAAVKWLNSYAFGKKAGVVPDASGGQ